MDNNSFWIDSVKLKNYKSLENNITTEVCVIGGGITGITTAYYLSKKGKDVVVVEKDTIASKTTGHTTGKVSIQHGLFYKYLLESNGLNYAKRYSEVNKKAIKNINEIIETENISCDFEKRDSFVFATSPAKYKSINDEVEVCKQLGIEAEFQKQMELPINIQGAVKIKDQAQFNSVKYISGLCDCLISNGAHIYEHSQAINFKKRNGKFEIRVNSNNNEYTILAEKVVVATRYPIFDFPGIFFIKTYQELEYVMCAKVQKDIESLRDVCIC